MRVIPIASTECDTEALASETEYVQHEDCYSEIDELAEFAGRNCYLSWNRPNPATQSNEGYLSNILKMGHESVLEHASVTFYVEDASRAFLAEISRHRHLSFSVVSQRFVDANELPTVFPPIIEDLPEPDVAVAESMIEEHAYYSLEVYDKLVSLFNSNGAKRKQAREGARAVLPSSTDSPLVVTGNLRAWRDVLKKRHHVAADRELQEFAAEVLWHLRSIAPNSVQDIPHEPYS